MSALPGMKLTSNHNASTSSANAAASAMTLMLAVSVTKRIASAATRGRPMRVLRIGKPICWLAKISLSITLHLFLETSRTQMRSYYGTATTEGTTSVATGRLAGAVST